ncbi:ornithine cyclodeaminase [Amycolatopsis jiangsuensis]|uniref:Ornithine cyclodeaminase n=1 Tax=Amycolatopsis jiangsuensis TaxID=1181879 RepID=A0A840J0R5_9PSEU|nr:ornithine cyclodeaminase [Amycolatopsis jiangsuensis]MBB4688691.1 ornithine cyclodeaminase [Amycolatopsis jiangsuensis]
MPTPELHILTRSELAGLDISPQEVIGAVRAAYAAYAEGKSRNPAKLMMPVPAGRDAVSYAMLGFDGALEYVGFKTSYRQGTDNPDKYYTTISLYDDTTGLPYVFMDCHRVGGSRTPATTALIAEECARPGARSALLIGTGRQSLNTLPYLVTRMPQLEKLRFFGTHPEGITATAATFAQYFPDRKLEQIGDVPSAVAESDIVIAASGRAAHPPVRTSWLPPGGLLISVSSKGVDSSALAEADYALATSESQLGVTGSRFDSEDGAAVLDAEFPDVVAGRKPGRRSGDDRVFAFSSGMVITDIPVAHALAAKAIDAGLGQKVQLWT